MASPFPQITSPPQAQAEAIANEALETLGHQAVYGKDQDTTTALIWGYYGGRWGGFPITAATVTLTGSAVNYLVVAIATGVLSTSTATTNWNDPTNYARVYKLTTGVASVTTVDDYRAGPGGVGGGAGGTGVAFTGGTLTSALNEAPPVTLASAATVNIGAAAANTINVTGTVTITAFDTIAAGALRCVIFSGILTLTYNATSLILPGAANITTAAGDSAFFESLGSGNWRCVGYQRASGTAVVVSGGVSSVDASGGVQTVSGSAITATGTIRAANVINAQAGTTYALIATDRGKHVTLSNASSIAVSIAQAGTTGFEDGYGSYVENIGVGAVTITPSTSTINGASTLVLDSGMAAILFSDGTNYRAFVLDPAGVAVNAQTGTTYTVVSGDRSKLNTFTNASSIAVTLPQATGAFGSRWFAWFQNRGAGTVTITPTTSTIDGAASLALTTGQGAFLASDGTNYFTQRGSSASSFTGGTLTTALNEAPGVTIASSSTPAIGAAAANTIDITGVATITAFDTIAAGARRLTYFSGALVLTHNATSLILVTAANITTIAGDSAEWESLGSGNWRMISYNRASGSPLFVTLGNWTEALGSATPNATVTVSSFTAANAATNVDAALIPKGTGSILSAVPNNLTTGGNKRGITSVDLQLTRGANTQVASGQSAGLLAGTSNTASGQQSAVVAGNSNTASNTNAFVGAGVGNTASGTDATVGGGDTNTASGDYSAITGGQQGTTRGLRGMYAHASGNFSAQGDAQFGRYVQRLLTTTATTTAVTADGTGASTTNTIVMPNNSAYCGNSRIVARKDATDQAMFTIVWAAARGANAAATALVGTPTVVTVGATAGAAAWTVAAVANTTNGSVEIKVTGAAATNIKWVSVTDTTEESG